ncbi:amino acid ABC transporter permease [Bradyrhizobium sp. CCGUVB1N3]|uniref:amino acid ABC transporter permease n=1 Tax=Bradyrhizobium sp. CCGUVB1N3 TaxID=2949629 RepID=UPI0020B299EE|nr:amino acid ABC transporter permease [Bradyrhizobium sp. CCGUVB1N3]MCP3470056.1 amino acid ABC transporter permease [Bradyrhizobium sp. CCGUVB1N3]
MGYVFDPAAVLTGQYLDWFIWGLATTIALTLAAWLLGMTIGIILTLVRMLPFRPFEWLVAGYVEYHRNVPLLVQILVWYFGVPQLLPRALRMWVNSHHSEFLLAMVALGLASAAYITEDLRSGIRSIPKTQYEAARSIGFSYLQAMSYVILPQALRIVIPPLINQTLLLFKNTSLAMAIGVGELTYRTREVDSYTFKTFEAFAVATIIYLAISFAIMALGAFADRRLKLELR